MSNSNFKKISPDSRNKLIGLVNKTAEFVNSGHTPTDALVKAASLGDQYEPEFILRAAEAYNGAAHLSHFEKASSESRGDSFSLVDGHQVLRDLIANKKVARETKVDQVDFFSDDRTYFTLPMYEKAAEAQEKRAYSAPPAPVGLKEIIEGARKLDEKEKLAIDLARGEAQQALKDLDSLTKEVKKSFASLPASELTKIGSLLVNNHGKDAAIVANSLCGLSTEEGIKIAEYTGRAYFVADTEETKTASEVYVAYENCNRKFEDLAQKQADHYINSLERKEAVNEFLGLDNTPEVNTEKIAEVKETPVDDLNDLMGDASKEAAGVIAPAVSYNLIHRGMDSVLNPVGRETSRASETSSLEDYQLQGLRALMDPAFLKETKSIETAVNLKKILGQDPVIGSHSPREIEEALAEISTMAPNALNYEPLLRAMLRKRLESEGRLDDYEISQLLDTDIKVMGRDTPSQLFPQVKFLGDKK